MKHFNYFLLDPAAKNRINRTVIAAKLLEKYRGGASQYCALRSEGAQVTSGCSAVDVPMTSYGAPDEHPMSTRSASDERRWKNRAWKYVAMIFAVLMMSMANIGMAWADAADWTIAASNFTQSPTGTFTYEFSEVKIKNTVGSNAIYVEVPSASASGTVGWKGSGDQASRMLYIYGTNGTVKDEERGIAMGNKVYNNVSFSSSDIYTSGGKYYLVFKLASSSTDWKALGVKYVLAASSGKNIYLKPNGIWNTADPAARFAAYYFKSAGDGNGWVDFSSYNACTPCFKATIPSGYDKVILCRMDGSKAANNWDNRWNQTDNQTVPTGNDTCWTVTDWSAGSWGTYTAPTYTISFAGNDNTGGSMSSISSIACEANQTVTANAYTKTGHSFTGWKADVDVKVGGSIKTAGTLLADKVTIQDISSNITLTAQWEAAKYAVTYNVNGGGSVTPTSATQASSGASVTLPTPTWSGYTFEGWYNAGTKIGVGGASYTPTADITLYAHWTDNISGKVFSFIDNNYGDKFKSFTGYGWVAKDSTGRSKTFTNASTGVEYRVSAACWDKKNNAISALAKFKSGTTSMSIVIPTGKIATVKISYGAYNTSNRLTVGGNNQTALSTALTDDMTNVQVYNALTEVTLNSQTGTLTLGSSTGNIYIGRVSAVITGYTVSYAAGTYGSGSLASGTKTHGSNFTLSSSDDSFTRDGYVYDGWSTNADGSTKDYNLGGSYTTDAPITLYPHWVAACTTPAAPTNFTAGSITATGATFTITDASDAASYDIYYSTESTAPTSGTAATTTSTSKTKEVTGLTAATTYYAWVRSVCDASHKSAWVALNPGGDTHTFVTSCVAPATVNVTATVNEVSGFWFYPDDDVVLTAAPTGSPAGSPVTYQWKKNGADIDGATSSTYTINEAAASDAGKYTCTISYGACSTTSAEFELKCMQFYLKNSGGGDISNHALTKVDATHATLSLSLTGGTTYKFRVTDGCNNWYGNTGEMTSSSCTDWTMKDDADCRITTNSKSATYTFNFDFTDGLLGKEMKVSVVYPAGNQAAEKVIYWDNSVLNWASAPWYRIGKSDHHNKTRMTLVPGTANLYKVMTAEYNGFEYWHIANNEGEGTGNIFWTKDSDPATNEAITVAMGFEGSPVTADAVTFTPTSSHGMGTSSANDNCDFYEYGQQNGMKTDRVTISPYSNGTITVNYVDTDEEAATLTTGYADLAHTVKLTSITAVPNTGYDAGAITINDDAYETNYVVTANTTIAASFTPHVYSITYLDKGGSAFSGSHADGYPTTHTYATATTLKTASKTGYTFDGWYGNSACTGAPMTSIGATSITADITLYAKWTAAASLTALECNTLYKVPDMIPSGASLTSSDQFFDGLSTNTKFELIGSGSDETTPKVNNSSSNDKTIDGITFDDGSMWFKGTASLTSNIPTTFGLSFIVPEGGGKLYLYFSGTSTNIKLAKSGEAGSKPSCPNGYGAVDVTAGTYYLYGTGTSAPYCFYGLKLCSTYSVSITTNNTTKTSGETGSTAAVNGKAYTAIFTANTGYTLPSDVTVSIGGTPATKGTEYTWSVSDGTGTLTVPAAYVTGDIVITVTGVDDGTSFDITYNYNGGTGSPASDRGSSVDLPNPTRSGYVLQGWYTTDGTKLGDGGEEGVALTEDVEVYAKWYATCEAGGGTITWDFSNRTASDFTSGSSYSFTATDGETEMRYTAGSTEGIVAKTDKKTGYLKENGNTGGGSYKDVDGTTAIGKNRLIRLFVGNWSGTLRINCTNDHSGTWKVLDGSASGTILISSLAMNTTSSKITVANSLLWIETTAKGYITSIVWTPSGGGGGTCRHVTYDGNGAESGFVNDTTSYASGDEVTVLGNGGRYPYVKSGYEIAGWADTKDKADAGTIDYAPGATFDITADKTLYAVWRVENIALVTYTLNVGSSAGTTLKSSVDSGDDTNVPNPILT